MAIQADTFSIPIKISDEVTKKVDEIVSRLNSTIKKIPKDIDMGKITKELKSVSQGMQSVGKDVKKANEAFVANSQIITQANDSMQTYNEQLNDNVRNLRLNQSAGNRVNSILLKYAGIVESAATLTNAFGMSLKNALNPRTLNRLENLLSIFAALAKLKGLDRLAKALLFAQNKVEDLELAMANLADNGEDDFERLAASADAFNGRLGVLGFAVHRVSGIIETVASSFVDGFLKVFNIFNILNNTIADVTLVVRSLFDSFKSFTDPAFVNNLANIFTIVSAFLRFKGQTDLADFFDNAADKADFMSNKLQEIKDDGGFSLEQTAEKAKLLTTAIRTVEFAIDGAKLAFAGFIGLQIAKRFDFVNNSMAKLDTGLKNVFKRSKVLGGFLNSRFNPGLIKLTEIATIISPLIFGLGKALSESEDAAVAFIGKITLAASIIAGSFATAMTLGIKLVSDFAISVGDKLIKMMERFSSISAKSEAAIEAFNFTIRGFNRVVGESVGTLEFWEKQIQSIVKASTFGSNEIRKGISLLVKEGAALGLNAIQNSKLAKIAADVAAATGREFADVSQRIVEGLAGQSQGLLALGINVKETHLAHSDLLKQLGKTTSKMSEAEKQTLRFNEVIKQTEPLMGAAAAAMDTVEGATKVYNRTLEEIQIRIGEADAVTKFYLRTLTRLSTAFLSLPDPMLEVIGSFVDFGGVTLKIIGTLVKYILTIGFVVTAITLMNKALGTSITLQSALGLVLGTVAVKMKVQAVAITGLNALFLQMSLIVKGALLQSLRLLGAALLGVAATIAKVTASILINPLFLKAVLIATGIAAVVKAVSELAKEFDFLVVPMDEVGGLVDILGSALNGLLQIVNKLFGGLVDLTKIILGGLVGGVLMLIRAWKSWQFIMADGKEERQQIQKDIDEIDEKLRKVDETIRESSKGLREIWGNSSAAAQEAKKNIDLEIFAANQAKNLEKMEEALAGVNKESLKIGVLGNEFQKINLKLKESESTFKNLFDKLKNGADLSKESIVELKDAYTSFVQTTFEMQGLRSDTFKEIEENINDLRIESLKSSGQEIKAIEETAKLRTKEFDKRVEQIRSVFTLTASEESKISQMRILMAAKTEREIIKIRQKERNKTVEQAAQASDKEAKFFAGMMSANLNLRKQALEADGQFVAAQEIQNQMALKGLDEKIKRFVDEQKILDENFKLSKDQLDIINKQKGAIEKRNEAELKKAAKKEQKAAQDAVGPGGPQLFGEQQVGLITSAFGEGAGAIASSVSGALNPVMAAMGAAQAIVGAIQQLIDFIPQILDAVANIFNSLTELPLKAAESFSKLLDSIGNVIKNLPANIVKGFTKNITSLVNLIFETLPEAFSEMPVLLIDALLDLVSKLPIFMKKLAVGFIRLLITAPIQMIKAYADGIPILIAELVKAVPEIALALIDGIILGLKEAANALANLLGFEDIFDIPNIEDKISGLGDQIKRASSQIFEVLDLEAAGRGLDIADRIRNALASGASQGASFFERLFKKIKQFGQDLWDGFVGAVKDIAAWFGDRGTEIWNGFILPIAAWFGDRGTEIWNGFILPIANFFGDAGTQIWEGFILPIANFFGDMGTEIWNGFILPIATFFGDAGTQIWNGFILPIADFFKDLGGEIWDGFLAPIGTAFTLFGKNIWNGFKTNIEGLTNFFEDLGKDIWTGLDNAIDWPDIPVPGWLQSFIDAVNSLTNWSLPFSSGGLVGKVENSIPQPGGFVGQSIEKLTSFYSEGGSVGSVSVPTGQVRNAVLYAQTGAFAAQGTDTVPAMLTPGEFVVNRESTRNNLGLLSFINQNKDSVAPGSPQNSTFNITINAKTNLTPDQVRREIVPELEKHLRRKSQEGRSVINAAGIRT